MISSTHIFSHNCPFVTVHGSVCSFCVSACCPLSDCLSALLQQPQCWWANALSAAFIWLAFAVHVVRSLFAHARLFSPVLCLLFVSCLGLLLFWIGPVHRSLRALEICSSAWDLLATHRASSLTVCQINVTPLATGFWVLIPWQNDLTTDGSSKCLRTERNSYQQQYSYGTARGTDHGYRSCRSDTVNTGLGVNHSVPTV